MKEQGPGPGPGAGARGRAPPSAACRAVKPRSNQHIARLIHSDSQKSAVDARMSRNCRGDPAFGAGKFPADTLHRQEEIMGSFAEGLPNRFPVGTRYVVEGPWRRPRSPSHPFAISRVSRRQASQTPSRRRASDTLAAPPRRTENNFAHRKPGQDLGVEPTAPGGVPPSPQPLTHPAIRPWPFWPGSSFLGGAARNRRIRGGGLCPPDKPRVLSRVAVATDDV